MSTCDVHASTICLQTVGASLIRSNLQSLVMRRCKFFNSTKNGFTTGNGTLMYSGKYDVIPPSLQRMTLKSIKLVTSDVIGSTAVKQRNSYLPSTIHFAVTVMFVPRCFIFDGSL